MLTIGRTRSGKTYGAITSIMRNVGRMGGVVLDPQSSIAPMLLKCCAYRKKLDQIVYLSLGQINKRFGIFNLRDDVRKYVRAPMNARGIDFLSSPLIYEWLRDAHELVKQANVPLHYLPQCFDPELIEFNWMMKRLPEGRLKQKWMSTVFFSAKQRRDELGPALRLVESYATDTDFQLLCANDHTSQVLYEAIANRKLVIFEGGHADPQTVQMIYSLIISMMIEFHRMYAISAITCVDELCNYNLLSRELAVACAAEVKHGFRPFFLTQALTGEEEDIELLMQNVQLIDCYAITGQETLKHLSYIISTANLVIPEMTMEGVHQATVVEQERKAARGLLQLPPGAFVRIQNGRAKWLKNRKARMPFSNDSSWGKKRRSILLKMNEQYESPEVIAPPSDLEPLLERKKRKGRSKS